MPAGIYENDVFGEIRKHGQRAWHGLGDELPEGLTCEEGFERLKLNWTTRLMPLLAQDELALDDQNPLIEVEGKFAHVREDTRSVLGVVGSNYRPIPNVELAKFADALVGADAAVICETAGSLHNGKRVFCSVKLPRTIEVVKEDILDMYVILSNSHDGNSTAKAYPSSIRPVCVNTLTASEANLVRGLRIQHTGSIDKKIDQARRVLGLVIHELDRFEEEVQRALRLNLSVKEARAYFEAVYTIVFGKGRTPEPEEGSNEEKIEGAQTVEVSNKHKEKIVGRWMELLEDKRQQVKGIQGTGWAAYNAFSCWSDHERGDKVGERGREQHTNSVLFGASDLVKRRAWKKVLQTN